MLAAALAQAQTSAEVCCNERSTCTAPFLALRMLCDFLLLGGRWRAHLLKPQAATVCDMRLTRAWCLQEVTGQTEQAAAGAGGELLNAFNVATFKNDEDDTAFWNRLIPAGQLASEKEEPQELGIRAARLKVYDEVCAF